MWLDDDGSVYNDKSSYDYYQMFKLNWVKTKIEADTEALDNIDIKFIENYLRKKKLEIINKK